MRRTPTPQKIGARIERARETAGLSRESLAGALEISLDTLKRYERGQTDPTYLLICQVSDLTGKPIDWFVGDPVAA